MYIIHNILYTEQGFDEDDLSGEFTGSLEDCTLIEFHCDDDDKNLFPLREPIDDPGQKNEKGISRHKYTSIYTKCIQNIYKIYTNYIQNIYTIYTVFELLTEMRESGIAPSPYISVDDINLKIQDESKKNSNKTYKELCPEIYEKSKAELDLMHCLAATEVNNEFPFVLYLVDAFSRDRVETQIKTGNAPDISTWTTTPFHGSYLDKLRKSDKENHEKISNGMKGYCNRILPTFQFTPQQTINDNIEKISDYILVTSIFIQNLIKTSHVVPPFQIDLLIAVRDISSGTKPLEIDLSDDGDDGDDDGM